MTVTKRLRLLMASLRVTPLGIGPDRLVCIAALVACISWLGIAVVRRPQGRFMTLRGKAIPPESPSSWLKASM